MQMMDDVENGKVGMVIMKNMTRWGRDYLQVGNAMEVFRRDNVRFIAIATEAPYGDRKGPDNAAG